MTCLVGFSKDETAEGVLLCRSNLLSTIHTLVNWCLTTGHHFDKAETRKELQDHEKIIMEHTDDGPPEIGEIIAKMWEHSVGIKEAFRQLTVEGTTLMDSAKYFLDKAEDVFKADFVPTHEDILFTRKVYFVPETRTSLLLCLILALMCSLCVCGCLWVMVMLTALEPLPGHEGFALDQVCHGWQQSAHD